MSIDFPNWPPRDEHEHYEYLASVGFEKEVLESICVKEAVVVGIYSSTSVNVMLDEVIYEDIPVYIHTDVGCRAAILREEEAAIPETYFKNAAFMFPLPGGQSISGGVTKEPKVHVAVFNGEDGPEVLFVQSIVQNMLLSTEETPRGLHKTYNPIVSVFINNNVSLFDACTGEVLQIPSRDESDKPVLPMIECLNITTSSDEYPLVIDYLSMAIPILAKSSPFSSRVKIGDSWRNRPYYDYTGYYQDNEYITININLNPQDRLSVTWDAYGATWDMYPDHYFPEFDYSRPYNVFSFPVIADEGTIEELYFVHPLMVTSLLEIYDADTIVSGGVIANRYNGYASYVATFANGKGTLTVIASGLIDGSSISNPVIRQYRESYELVYDGVTYSFDINADTEITYLSYTHDSYGKLPYTFDAKAMAIVDFWAESSNNHFASGIIGFSGRVFKPLRFTHLANQSNGTIEWIGDADASILAVVDTETIGDIRQSLLTAIPEFVRSAVITSADIRSINHNMGFRFSVDMAMSLRPTILSELLI